MSLWRRCCVAECNGWSTIGHAIPVDLRARAVWLERIGDASLLENGGRSLNNVRMCDAHFERVCVVERTGKLRPRALPTLNLPGYVRVPGDNFLINKEPRGFELPVEVRKGINLIWGTETTSSRSSPELKVTKPTHVYGKRLRLEGVAEQAANVERHSPEPGPSGISNMEQDAETPGVVAASTRAGKKSTSRKRLTITRRRKLQKITLAGHVALLRKIVWEQTTCSFCREILFADQEIRQNLLIRKRTYEKGNLLNPSYTRVFRDFSHQVHQIHPSSIHLPHVRSRIKAVVDTGVLAELFCSEHKDSANILSDRAIKFLIFNITTVCNRVLSGKDSRSKNFNALTKLAHIKFKERRRHI